MTNPIIPVRIQRKRTKGYKQPPNTIYCGRPGQWGNPFATVDEYKESWVAYGPVLRSMQISADCEPGWFGWWFSNLHTLSGHYLSCWCPLDQSCHVDVLIEAFKRKFPEAVEMKGGE